MIIIEIIYAFACVAFAGLNARWIQQAKRIKHFWNGLLHIAVAAGAALFLKAWEPAVIILCNSRIIFDLWLNIFRDDVPWDYVPSKPKSIVDQVEKFLFNKDFITPRILYALISVVCHAIYFK